MSTSSRNKFDESTLVSQKFGLLTVQKAWRNSKNEILTQCLCECGNKWQGLYHSIRVARTKSCGCLAKKNSQDWQQCSIKFGRKKYL